MPDWQSLLVAVIVSGAVLFLVRRFVRIRRRRRTPARTFVPLAKVARRKPDDRG